MNGGSGDAPTQPQQEAAHAAIAVSLLRLTLSPEQPSVQQHLQGRDLTGQLPNNPAVVIFETEMIKHFRKLSIISLLSSIPSVHVSSWALRTEDKRSGF